MLPEVNPWIVQFLRFIRSLFASLQLNNVKLQAEQESRKFHQMQEDLKAQEQEVNALRTSQKQMKQELKHMLDVKQNLEKQNQELQE